MEKKRFSPHDFRSFVQGALENGGVHSNIVSVLIGHKPQGVNFNYSEHDIDEFKKTFKKALPFLLPEQIEVDQLRQRSESEHQEFRKMQGELTELRGWYAELKETIGMAGSLANNKDIDDLHKFLLDVMKGRINGHKAK